MRVEALVSSWCAWLVARSRQRVYRGGGGSAGDTRKQMGCDYGYGGNSAVSPRLASKEYREKRRNDQATVPRFFWFEIDAMISVFRAAAGGGSYYPVARLHYAMQCMFHTLYIFSHVTCGAVGMNPNL